MPQPLPDQIIRKAEEAGGLYYRLVLLVAPAGSGKTPALREVGKRLELPVINVNLELTRRMLDLTERQRSLKVPLLLSQVTDQGGGPMVLLDNIEILFDTAAPSRTLKRETLMLRREVNPCLPRHPGAETLLHFIASKLPFGLTTYTHRPGHGAQLWPCPS